MPPIEPRTAPRRRQLKAAIIAFQNRHATLPCRVREISEAGARLEVGTPHVPDTFELIVELDGIEADCEVVWRRGSLTGVRFLGPPRKGEPRRAQVINPTSPPQAPGLRRKPVA